MPPPTPCSGTPTTPGPVEYNQNNGQPVVIYAFNDASNEVSQPIAPVLPATPCSNPGPITVPAPAPAPVPAPEPSDLENAQSIADQSVNEQGLETIPAPDQPCKVETSTEIVQAPGETFVHQPGEILINQPPTRLIINHAPYIVRPSAVVVNQGGKKITNEYTRKILPSAIQLRPIIVRIVKPIEKKVLIDKPQQPGCQNYAQTPVIPDQCATALASASSTAPVAYAPVSYPTASVDSTDYSALLAQAGYVSICTRLSLDVKC